MGNIEGQEIDNNTISQVTNILQDKDAISNLVSVLEKKRDQGNNDFELRADDSVGGGPQVLQPDLPEQHAPEPEKQPAPEKQSVDPCEFDTYTVDQIIKYVKENRPTKIHIADNFAELIKDVDLVNNTLMGMCLEFYQKVKAVIPKPTVDTTKKKAPPKKRYFIQPRFGVDQIIASNKIAPKKIEAFKELIKINPPTVPFNNNKVTIEEFSSSMKIPSINKDMIGISKKMMMSLPKYHIVRFVNCYNKLYEGRGDISKASFGKATYIYKESKAGPKNDINSFRQIMSIPVPVNHFHRILGLRLASYITANKYMDTDIQKGALPNVGGVIDQIYKVRKAITHANKKKKNLCVMFLDISNAYGNLNRKVLSDILRRYHVPQRLITYIEKYYGDFKYYVKSYKLDTDPLEWTEGLVQGCPMSAVLFVLALNYVLEYIDKKWKVTHGCKYTTDEGKLVNFLLTAFIDDIAIITNSMKEMKDVFEDLKMELEYLGFPLNLDKCAIMEINPTDNTTVIPDIKVVHSYKYLGEYVSSDGTYLKSFNELKTELGRRLYALDKRRTSNENRVISFCTSTLPWLQRRLKILYDLSKADKLSVVSMINTHLTKWGKNFAGTRIFTSLLGFITDTQDNVIRVMDNREITEEDYEEDLNLANTYLTSEKANTITYDLIKKDAAKKPIKVTDNKAKKPALAN